MSSWAISPLRYPGGKGVLAPFLGRLLEAQYPRSDVYIEPFAGGAGAALRLLYDEHVREVVLNDINPGIAAFWRSVFNRTADLAALIENVEISVETWKVQQSIYRNPAATDDLTLGFATFFLNRTNRSGILDAWPIGGLEQVGTWKLDARFNRSALAGKVKTLGRYRNRVTVLQEDGIDLVERYRGRRQFIYADPPYLQKGGDLYVDTVSWSDHQRLSSALCAGGGGSWMVTYDDDPRVRKLYPKSRAATFQISHRAREHRVGAEIAVFSNDLNVTNLDGLGTRATLVRS